MCIYSDYRIAWERRNLAPYAVRSDNPWYCKREIDSKDPDLDECGNKSRYRTAFDIDKDRITNSQAFRRLEYKTQVFVTHEGDNFRTRLTHSLEVAEIARHIARALRLNEILVEAIALGHDIGHAPYGHAAEEVINRWIREHEELKDQFYFCHNRQSVETVEELEPGYDWDRREPDQRFARGLNLTRAVREGILVHTQRGFIGQIHNHVAGLHGEYEIPIRKLAANARDKGLLYPGSLEAQVIRVSDDLAQRIHDIEDGLRSRMLTKEDLRECLEGFFFPQHPLRSHLNDTRAPFRIGWAKDREHIVLKSNAGGSVQNSSRVYVGLLLDVLSFHSESGSKEKPIDQGTLRCDKSQHEIAAAFLRYTQNNSTDFKRRFDLLAHVAFLLHMWRDLDFLSRLTKDEYTLTVSRLLKYFNLIVQILDHSNNSMHVPPAYHFVAFLRGIMLANIIEHSFWNIHKRLNPQFRRAEHDFVQAVKPVKNSDRQLIIFCIVDGLVSFNPQGQPEKFEAFPIGKENKLIGFEFAQRDGSAEQFILSDLSAILRSNGSILLEYLSQKSPLIYPVKSVTWLNKSQEIENTQFVKIVKQSNDAIFVRIEDISVYFTGYREICGTSHEVTCRFASNQKLSGGACVRNCVFFSGDTVRPDINRLIELHPHMSELDLRLKHLVIDKIQNRSRVQRMDLMGKRVIRNLLNRYFKHPRLMHDRVWSRLRSYANDVGTDDLSQPILSWIEKSMLDKEQTAISNECLELLASGGDNDLQKRANRLAFARRIIDHIAGMTDRYIANEYNRLRQSGREVELQDETYFFL